MMDASEDKEIEQQLMRAGNRLGEPPSSVNELLALLDQLEQCLRKVEQAPKKSMLDALDPSLKALVANQLIRHSDVDVKVAVASCIIEIMRITAPEAPYCDDRLKEIFRLMVSSFKNLSDKSSRSYNKRTSILETMAKVRLCVIMMDLECDALIIEMFRHFLETIRNYHPQKVFSHMETIMTCILQEIDDITVELISPILASVKNNEGVLPIARKLGETVLKNSASRLEPCLIQAVKTLGISRDEYSKVVYFICEELSIYEHKDVHSANEHIAEGSKMAKASSVGEAEQVKEEIESEAASPEQIGPTNGKSSKPVGDPQISEYASLVDSDLGMPSAEDGDKKASEGTDNSEAKLHSCSGIEVPTRTSNETPIMVEASKREIRIENDSEAKSPKQLVKKVDSLSKIGDGISPIRLEDRGQVNAVYEKVVIEDSTKDDKELISSPKAAEHYLKESSKSKSKRKHTSVKDKEPDAEGSGENLVGKKVKVWWPIDKTYYEGVIGTFDSVKKEHKVLYVDGDVEMLNLKKEKWKIIADFSGSDGEGADQPSPDATSEMPPKKKLKTNSDQPTKHGKFDASHKRVGSTSSGKSKGAGTKGKSKNVSKAGRKSNADSKIINKSDDDDGSKSRHYTPKSLRKLKKDDKVAARTSNSKEERTIALKTSKPKQDNSKSRQSRKYTPNATSSGKGKTPKSGQKTRANGSVKLQPGSLKVKGAEDMKGDSNDTAKVTEKTKGKLASSSKAQKKYRRA
ncbi:uncharacterized protein LOC120013237 [Tripterygium wilfordii]|uniref:uncharacterized protein LOC120013237 n=1 Tax=Tripterygium wilfordii TaxID=458696 RepID=UPI0018F7F65D|nr:uncharacterized protein LOC120013237 [Tripterygium wilfordii]